MLRCSSGAPLIVVIPRLPPAAIAGRLLAEHPSFFLKYPTAAAGDKRRPSGLHTTLRAFGDEWRRFPQLLEAYRVIFAWYFEGPEPVRWKGLKVLDAGCGMGLWLHVARKAGADVVGMDVSAAIDVAVAQDGDGANFVQADLLFPPFACESFDLVYSLEVVHHLEEPMAGVRALAKLVRPGGELRPYVYRTLEGEPLG